MRREGAEVVLAERREAPCTCIDGNCRRRVKSLKMVKKTSDKNQFSYFYILNPFVKLTRFDHSAL